MSTPWPTGVGLGWRPEIASVFDELPGLRFTEVIAESLSGPLPPGLTRLRDQNVTVVPHGVGLSLGGAEPLDPARVEFLANCAQRLRSPLVSEHLAFVRAGGMEVRHLLPVPRTWEMTALLCERIRQAQQQLPVPLAVEPIATLFDWPDDELCEVDFVTEVLERTDALLLLDLANLYANARNRGLDPVRQLQRLPLERIGYVHVAGGAAHEGHYHDTHTDPTPSEVLDLVAELGRLRPVPGLLLERDGNYPPKAEFHAELDAIAEAARHPRITGSSP